MKINKFRNNVKYNRTERLVNLLVLFIGITSTVSGIVFLFYGYETFSAILISVGSSLIASAVVMFLTLIYLDKYAKGHVLTEYWGLEEIYSRRSDMGDDEYNSLKFAKKSLDTCSFGSYTMRSNPSSDKIVRENVKLGLRIRFLVINPNSKLLEQRERDEGLPLGTLRHNILTLIAWMEELKRIAPISENITLKIYDALPLDFYTRTDKSIYIGPYLYGKPSRNTIAMRFEVNSKGFEYYADYFEELWNNSNFAKSLDNSLIIQSVNITDV